ncbi:unnamed protein product [Caenorhabditis bovis]|uniref:T20D4.11-like domain-containing protein n=1 Tax=Caenorhabditis bovis TaxID=2654633 RepID=A0A8S1E9P5_9PELO|nr:unnamed protein product [Caenorhabditis bovis]
MLFKSSLIFVAVIGASLAATASQCAKKEAKAVKECVQLLQDSTEGVKKLFASNFDKKNQDEMNEICKKSQACFADLKKKCSDFPPEATSTLDFICGKIEFFTGPFSECMIKLIKLDDTPTGGCGEKMLNSEIFENPKNACKAVKDTIGCEKDIGKVCDAAAEKLFHDENQKDLKKYKC